MGIALGLLLTRGGMTFAGGPPGSPSCPPPPCATPYQYPSAVPGTAPGMPGTIPGTTPTTPGAAAQPPAMTAQPPSTDAFAQAPPAGGEAAQSALPNMIGDLGISSSTLQFITSTQTVTSINSFGQSVTRTVTTRTPIHVPIVSRGIFKISDDESPRPQDRVYIGYNYFADVSIPGSPTSQVHVETFGFEKTLFDGAASFGIRVPVIQQSGDFGSDDVGDLSFILKYALYDDRQTGNLFSAGLVVTAPTGRSIDLADGTDIHSTLIQPYVGAIWTADRFYLNGFAEVVVPTNARDVTFGALDIGMGYRLADYFIPTFETHVNTSFNHHGIENDPIGFSDSVILTGGFHSIIGRAIFTAGVAVPVTGPRLEDVEAIVQFNFRF
jgi:hypothetical protein